MRAAARAPASPDVEEFVVAADRFAGSVAFSDLRAPVAACPGWTALDLVLHLGNVHAWAATIVETGRPAREQEDQPRSTRAKSVGAWYVAKAEDLYQVLRQVPPERACWNFVEELGTVAFWPRRQLHETTIHQVDLDLACGRSTRLSSGVADDGVSEVLDLLVHRMHARGHQAELVEPLALTATDTGHSWLVVPAAGAPQVEHLAARPTGVRDRVEAPADVLYRLLWQREVEPDAVRSSGSAERVQAFLGSRLTP